MRLSDYEYELPEDAIASHPPKQRGDSRLLALNRRSGDITDSYYKNLADQLKDGDVLVINNTRVIRARLIAQTEAGSKRELLLLEKHRQNYNPHRMRVMYRRRLHDKQTIMVGTTKITVEKVHGDGTATISSNANLLELAEKLGSVPLPPYMHRQADKSDIERYQTVFAREPGSVAAPTASLNLTESILKDIKAKGVEVVELTLHVGLGTFMPIRSDDITDHKMHSEYFVIPKETLTAIHKAKNKNHRVIAVGTTVTRTLEYVSDKLLHSNTNQSLSGEADIFIYPGYEFKVVDAMVTNFHAPNSTVLMMAAAFAGWDNLKNSYEHAIASGYKLLSYGDSMFIC